MKTLNEIGKWVPNFGGEWNGETNGGGWQLGQLRFG